MPKNPKVIESSDPDPEEEAIESLYAEADEATKELQEALEATEGESEGEGGANPKDESPADEAESSGASDQDEDRDDQGEYATAAEAEYTEPKPFPYTIYPRWENASNEALRREINGWSHIKKLPEDFDFDSDFMRKYLAYLNHCGAMGVDPARWLSFYEVPF